MTEDLISNNFITTVDKSIVKKLLSLSRFVLAMVLVYAFLDIGDWYMAITRYSWDHEFKSAQSFYEYRIHPFIALFLLILSIFTWSMNVKGNKMMVLSIENEDIGIFNNAYRTYYKALKLTTATLCISIISISIRLFLK